NYLASTPLVRRRSRLLRPLAARVERRILTGAEVLPVITTQLLEELAARGIPRDRLVLTPNAVDAEEFAIPPDGREARARLEIPADAAVVGFVGGFYPWHGLDLLVEALRPLAGPGLFVLLVGDGPERARLEALAGSPAYRFSGAVPRGELRGVLGAMDVAVIPDSNDYGSPMKMFEYLAAGKIGVFPRLGPVTDIVRDGEHALLFDRGDVSSLRAALRRALEGGAALRGMAAAGRAKVLSEHTWLRNAQRILGTRYLRQSAQLYGK
ncbi:MAG: glycosyltransferase, partial [Planctomycetota bacterium]